MAKKPYSIACLHADLTAPPFEKTPMAHQQQQDMIDTILRLLNQLSPVLQAILDVELKRGNKVTGAGVDWPEPGSIHVSLNKRFTIARQKGPGLVYEQNDDPHYWSANYATTDHPIHLLIGG